MDVFSELFIFNGTSVARTAFKNAFQNFEHVTCDGFFFNPTIVGRVIIIARL